MNQLFPGTRTFHHRQIREETDREFTAEWSQMEADFKVKCACRDCNAGWMNRLDHAAEDVFLTRAAIGLEVRVGKSADKATIALWWP